MLSAVEAFLGHLAEPVLDEKHYITTIGHQEV
jgi:hypothetical protein